MNTIHQAYVWLNDPLNWTNSGGIFDRLQEHLTITILSVLLACLVGWPLGLWLGHAGRAGELVVVISNITRAIPVLAMLAILPLTPLGFGNKPIVVALAIFAIPPLLANAYTGLREVDPEVRDAARGMGLSGWQLLRRVELPLAMPYLAAGFRTAAVQVIATATFAALIGGGGLGNIINAGFGLGLVQGGGQVVAGGVLVALLALLAEGVLALVERAATPVALRRDRRTRHARRLAPADAD